jgi:hypothetical protein
MSPSLVTQSLQNPPEISSECIRLGNNAGSRWIQGARDHEAVAPPSPPHVFDAAAAALRRLYRAAAATGDARWLAMLRKLPNLLGDTARADEGKRMRVSSGVSAVPLGRRWRW